MAISPPRMQKRYYNAASLERSLGAFERLYGMSSDEFYKAHSAPGDDSPLLKDVPRFERHVWASFYRELRRLNGEDFAERVERELVV
jgi:hypothetical protein